MRFIRQMPVGPNLNQWHQDSRPLLHSCILSSELSRCCMKTWINCRGVWKKALSDFWSHVKFLYQMSLTVLGLFTSTLSIIIIVTEGTFINRSPEHYTCQKAKQVLNLLITINQPCLTNNNFFNLALQSYQKNLFATNWNWNITLFSMGWEIIVNLT